MRYHLVVLVHGFGGSPSDLSYVSEKLSEHAHMLPYCSQVNHGNTSDGILPAAARLANEVVDVIAAHPTLTCVSFIGNSLGGLLVRAAISTLLDPVITPSQPRTIASLTPLVYVSLATPHLGVIENPYMPLPRSLRFVPSQWLGATISDLFLHSPGHSSVIQQLTDPASSAMIALGCFRERYCYGNTRGDTLVPEYSALFTLPHISRALTTSHAPASALSYQTLSGSVWLQRSSSNTEFIKCIVTTRFEPNVTNANGELAFSPDRVISSTDVGDSTQATSDVEDGQSAEPRDFTLEAEMAAQLDSLGWTKKFVAFPHSLSYGLPLSHHLICALSKNVVIRGMFRAGRPVVKDVVATVSAARPLHMSAL